MIDLYTTTNPLSQELSLSRKAPFVHPEHGEFESVLDCIMSLRNIAEPASSCPFDAKDKSLLLAYLYSHDTELDCRTLVKVIYRIWILQQPETLKRFVESKEPFYVDGKYVNWFSSFINKLRIELRIAQGIATAQELKKADVANVDHFVYRQYEEYCSSKCEAAAYDSDGVGTVILTIKTPVALATVVDSEFMKYVAYFNRVCDSQEVIDSFYGETS